MVLLVNGTIRPIAYPDGGVGEVSCPESSAFDHLAAVQVKDMYTFVGGLVLAITTDNKLIARSYTRPQWQGQVEVYSTSFNQ